VLKILQKLIFPLLAFVLGGFLIWLFLRPKTADILPKKACNYQYSFLSDQIDCENIDEKANQIENLHSGIQQIVDEEKSSKHIIRASIFYRDLNSRRWFGVNDIDKFYPASLIKLPIAIMYYKIAELEPGVFDKELKIPEDEGDNSDQYYPPVESLIAGKTYPIKELIRHMLEYSDNAPFSTLADAGKVFREKVLSDLSIYEPPAEEGEGAWSITARSYANIFRMLYNASYVNVRSANEILETLSRSTFDRGIVAGVPKGVPVAHKFGEAAGMDGDSNVKSLILNDCGIVYKKDSPYILCIMTEGTDYPSLEKTIQRISETIYNKL
jgi:beta-lactamase class A